jgi:two-component system, NarL family, sensor histidine kinase UhpB
MRTRLNSLPLFSRVFATNAAVLVLAFLALVFAPVTVSVPPTAIELAVLAVGLAGLLALNLGMLRPAFRPLDELVETMRGHDPLSPGKRVRVSGGPAIVALAQTFNEMLDRLESERRDSTRRALLVQEGERQRDRARAARRGRPDTHRRHAPGRGPGRHDPGRAPRPTR